MRPLLLFVALSVACCLLLVVCKIIMCVVVRCRLLVFGVRCRCLVFVVVSCSVADACCGLLVLFVA